MSSIYIKEVPLTISTNTGFRLLLITANNVEMYVMAGNITSEFRGKFNDFNPYSNLKFFNQLKFNDWSNVQDSIFLELKDKINNFKKPE